MTASEPIAMTASDLLTQWSINVNCVTRLYGCCSPASWSADCVEIVHADGVSDTIAL